MNKKVFSLIVALFGCCVGFAQGIGTVYDINEGYKGIGSDIIRYNKEKKENQFDIGELLDEFTRSYLNAMSAQQYEVARQQRQQSIDGIVKKAIKERPVVLMVEIQYSNPSRGKRNCSEKLPTNGWQVVDKTTGSRYYVMTKWDWNRFVPDYDGWKYPTTDVKKVQVSYGGKTTTVPRDPFGTSTVGGTQYVLIKAN